MKNFWRILWILAVALGGMTLVKVSIEILKKDNKKYIDM